MVPAVDDESLDTKQTTVLARPRNTRQGVSTTSGGFFICASAAWRATHPAAKGCAFPVCSTNTATSCLYSAKKAGSNRPDAFDDVAQLVERISALVRDGYAGSIPAVVCIGCHFVGAARPRERRIKSSHSAWSRGTKTSTDRIASDGQIR